MSFQALLDAVREVVLCHLPSACSVFCFSYLAEQKLMKSTIQWTDVMSVKHFSCSKWAKTIGNSLALRFSRQRYPASSIQLVKAAVAVLLFGGWRDQKSASSANASQGLGKEGDLLGGIDTNATFGSYSKCLSCQLQAAGVGLARNVVVLNVVLAALENGCIHSHLTLGRVSNPWVLVHYRPNVCLSGKCNT